jgi:hypothetical protein
MLGKLRRSAGDLSIHPVEADLADFTPTRRYSLVFCVWNTFYLLRTSEEQARCIRMIADALLPGGLFVIEAFVPDPDYFADGQEVRVREITADSVSLQVSLHDATRQTVASQHVVIRQDGIQLHPHEIRYAWPHQIDDMANAAGLYLSPDPPIGCWDGAEVGGGRLSGWLAVRKARGSRAWPVVAAWWRLGRGVWAVGGQRCSRRSGRTDQVVFGERAAPSSGVWERADAVQRSGVVAVPGPAGREVQRPAACVTGQSAGNCE